MANKPSSARQVRVAKVRELLEQGKQAKDIVPICAELYGVKERVVTKYIASAREAISETNKALEAVRLEQSTQSLKDAINEQILSDTAIEAILCKIITGDMEVEEFVKGRPVLRDVTPAEIVAAAKVVYAKRGSNAPQKQDVTIKALKVGYGDRID